VWLEYDDGGKEVHFVWETSALPIEELSGVNGQLVQVGNFPEKQRVLVDNIPLMQNVRVSGREVIFNYCNRYDIVLFFRRLGLMNDSDAVINNLYILCDGSLFHDYSNGDNIYLANGRFSFVTMSNNVYLFGDIFKFISGDQVYKKYGFFSFRYGSSAVLQCCFEILSRGSKFI
jgi:hypothetical protein